MDKEFPRERLPASFRIFNAGLELFSSLGYERTSISSICKKAGVNRAMVSYYYNGKLALYREIIEISYSRFLQTLREGVYHEKGPERRLRAFIRLNVEFNMNEPQASDIIVGEMVSNFARVGDILQKYFIQVLAVLTDVIQEGKDSGIFGESLSSVEIAFFVLGGINSFWLFSRLTRDTAFTPESDFQNTEAVIDMLYKFIIEGISSRCAEKV